MERARALRRPAALAVAALLSLAVPWSGAAHADTLADARKRAADLRAQVAALQARAELATEAYDASYAKLGAAVTAHLLAERDLAAAEQTSVASQDQAGRRVRALYMAGGTAGLYAQVLDSASITEVAQRVHQVYVVLADDASAHHAADQAVTHNRDAEARLAASAALSTALQKRVSQQADAVQALLAQADGLLSAADQQVRDLVVAQQQAAEAAAAAQGRAALEAARAALGNLPEAPPSAAAAAAIAFAQSQLGKPYVWGATGPDAYDCSGLTQAAYAAAGIRLPRVAQDQWYAGTRVELGALQPGDLLFWALDPADPATIHHVAMYLGGGMMIAAPHTGDVVKVQPVYLDGFAGAVRPS